MFVVALFIIAKNSGNSPNVHQLVNGKTKCSVSVQFFWLCILRSGIAGSYDILFLTF